MKRSPLGCRRRSSERLLRFWDEHSTIVVVSHDTAFVRKMCDRAMLLEEGKLLADGRSSDVADLYAERIAYFEANPPGPEWDGVFISETK